MLKQNEKSFSNFQKLIDFIIILTSWFLAYQIRFKYLGGAQQGLEILFAKISIFLVILSIYFLNKNKLYNSQRFNSRLFEILSIFKANFASFLALVLTIYFLFPERLSRTHLLIYFLISTFLLTLNRIILRNFLRRLRQKGKNLRHILLVGNGKQIENYIEMARKYKDSGLNFIGWIDDEDQASKFSIKSINSTYSTALEELRPDVVVIGYSGEMSYKTEVFLKENYNDIVPIQVLSDMTYSFVGHQIEDFAGIPLITVNQPTFSSLDHFTKRIFDTVLCSIGIVIISPLLLIIAFAVKISSAGPIFYGQERIGLNGRKFKMWKFRSMRVAVNNEDKTTWSSKDDPRKTKVGSFIRKTSIDELPQLWNVIVGQMSLVGPRPERPVFVEKFRKEIPAYMLKHKMMPGITGWAQVNGWRGDTSLEKRIECDLYYIKNWSFWLDIKIIFLTFWKGFINKNAY
ncbi:undecaprenyl-phosphate glucose phosphotransferase [Halobacteriovorax sp. HLS]|uniref:undecaprenyl-phosphate glucose phosphotransferase n=1 Tax=Halobacteriovorax sp. HLS TaxID=2234000 RepID=UPI000FD9E35F|nr:undecaprenyl-phosphate glucose phosphotransferase [Halobacteriovorax sp. HLS]